MSDVSHSSFLIRLTYLFSKTDKKGKTNKTVVAFGDYTRTA